jgi:hypothetical protein
MRLDRVGPGRVGRGETQLDLVAGRRRLNVALEAKRELEANARLGASVRLIVTLSTLIRISRGGLPQLE